MTDGAPRYDRPGPGERLNTGAVKPARPAASVMVLRDPGPEVPQVQLVDEDARDRRIGRRGLSRGVPGNGKAWLRIRDQRRCVPRDPPAKLRDDRCHPPERIQRPIVPGAAEVR